MIPKLLTENLVAKAMSLLIASLLWVALVAERELATAIDVPVEYRRFPKEYEVSSGMVNRVSVLVRGPSTRMNASDLMDGSVIVDLGGVKRPGEYTFNLDQETVQIPGGLNLERIVPSQIRMQFEERYGKDVRVRIRYEGRPMTGYRVARQEVYPENLRVVGPRSRVERMESIDTDPIPLSGIVDRETEMRVATFVEDQQVRIEGNSTVRVRIIMETIDGRDR
jgi:YbbR domain-containing protein